MLSGTSLKRNFIRYVIPSVVSQWVYALYTIVDGLFVARGVSEVALTAVNLSSPFVTTLFALSLIFAVGTSTVVAIFFGRGQREEGCQLFTQNVVIQLALSVPIIALLMPQLDRFALFLGAPDAQTAALVSEYLAWIVPFTPFFLLSYSFEIMLKIDGFPQRATAIVAIGVVANCILDWLFVMVFHKGVAGAAFATSISQGMVVLVYLIHFFRGKGTLSFRRFRFSPRLMVRQVRNGLSAGITEFSSGVTTFLFNQVIRLYLPAGTLVSYTIVSYVNSLVVLSATGISQGSQPLISYFHGKNDRASCSKLLRYCLITSLVFCAVCLAVCTLGAGTVVRLYITGPELDALRASSVTIFRIFILSFLPMGINVALSGYFTAVERPTQSLAISIGRGFLFLASFLVGLAVVFGGSAIWWAPLLSECVCLAMGIIMFRRLRAQGSVQGAQ